MYVITFTNALGAESQLQMSSNLSTENCKFINYSEFVFVFLSYDILLLPERSSRNER